MRKLKNILALLLTIAFVVTFAFGTAIPTFATSTQEYDLWVGGVRATSSNASDIFGNGTASYDPANNVLTLTNANISNYFYYVSGYQETVTIYTSSSNDLEIKLVGDNTISLDAKNAQLQNNISYYNEGIYTPNCGVSFSGDGDLAINVADYTKPDGFTFTTYSAGIDTMGLTFNGTGTISSKGGAADYSSGIESYGDFILNSGNITSIGATTNMCESYGLYCTSKIAMNGGMFTAKSGDSLNGTYAIYSAGTATINSSIVDAQSGNSVNNMSFGIYSAGLTIATSTINAQSGSCKLNSYGIYSGNDLSIDISTVTAVSGDSENESYGIKSMLATTITSSTVNAQSGSGKVNSYGIYSGTDLSVDSASTVTATSAGSQGDSYGIYAENNITFDSSIINATSGNEVDDSYAIECKGTLMTVKSGTVNATGGAGKYSCGIYCEYGFILEDGSVTALGGVADESGGLVTSTATINGGTLKAIASDDESATLSVGILTLDQLNCLDYYGGSVYMSGKFAFLGTFNNYSDKGEVYGSVTYNDFLSNMGITTFGDLTGRQDLPPVGLSTFFTDSAKTTEARSIAIGTIYSVTFEPNGGTCDTSAAKTVIDGTIKTLPTPTKTNYKFDGWYTLATGGDKVDTSTILTADTTLYAHFTSTVPATGDTTNLILYITIAIIAGTSFAIILIRRKRTQK